MDNMILHEIIPRKITFSPQHFMLYRGKLIFFGTLGGGDPHLCTIVHIQYDADSDSQVCNQRSPFEKCDCLHELKEKKTLKKCWDTQI